MAVSLLLLSSSSSSTIRGSPIIVVGSTIAWMVVAIAAVAVSSSWTPVVGVVSAFGVAVHPHHNTLRPSSTFSPFLQQQQQQQPAQLQQHRRWSSIRSSSSSSTVLFRIRCENKYYQLEEMEDRENCTTELFLKEDGEVLIGETDGPLWSEAVGAWKIRPGTDDFTMSIRRKFSSGQENSDMGEFEYELERTYIGDMTAVGESVAITGVMHCNDVLNGEDQEVGFFNMIDGTDIREDKRTDAKSGTGVDGKLVKDVAQAHAGASFISDNNNYGYNGGDEYAVAGGGGGYPGDSTYDYQQPAPPAQPYDPGYSSYGGGGDNGFYGGGQPQESYNDPGPPSFADYASGVQSGPPQQLSQPSSYGSDYDRQYQEQYYGVPEDQPQEPPPDEGWAKNNNNYQDNWPRYN